MAPTVPFALLGVVQLTAVAAWLALAAATALPALRRPSVWLLAAGALCLAAADAAVTVEFGTAQSTVIAVVRIAGLALLLAAALAGATAPRRRYLDPRTALGGIVAPLGATPALGYVAAGLGVAGFFATVTAARRRGGEPRGEWRGVAAADGPAAWWLGVGFLLTGVAAALAGGSTSSSAVATAQLGGRAAATLAITVAVLLVARSALVGKLVGAIVAGVVAMAVGAVAIAGSGVAGDVQHEQSARLLSVARSQVAALRGLESRAALNAQVVTACAQTPQTQVLRQCEQLLNDFAATPNYFAAFYRPGQLPAVFSPPRAHFTTAQLDALAGSPLVRAALRRGASALGAPRGPVLLPGQPERVAIVAAVPGRPRGVTSVQVRPTYAAIYGYGLVDGYLRTLRTQIGYDVSVVADGRLLASSLRGPARTAVLHEARSAGVDAAAAGSTTVVPAVGNDPTAAFVPVLAAGNADERLATLAVSQPASTALAAQQSVLRRLVLTALGVLLLVALLALGLARRIAEPVRRLTVAAGRVRRGDLDTEIAVRSRDEVGSLARAFDAMTSSLRSLTSDLRDAADAEAALRARLETVIAAMTDGVLATDATGIVTTVNAEALRLLECGSPDDIVGRPLVTVADVRSAPDGEALLPALRLEAEGVLQRDQGRPPLPVRVAVAPLAGEGGTVVMLGDRSREAEVERMKTEFLSNVSHELRTPMTPIRGYAELLARRALQPAQIETFAGEILTASARMNRVVELLVDVAALDAGRVTPRLAELPVAGFLDDAVTAWRARWPERAADLQRSVARGVPWIHTDPEWLRKALTELVDNALKVTTAGSAIVIRAELDPAANGSTAGRVRIKVVDSGPGIEPDRLGELFGDFSQADGSETRRLEGLGLGLGFVRRVSERFGLGIHVASQPGRGTAVGLDVPAAASGDGRRRSVRRPARGARPGSGDRLRARATKGDP